MTVRVINAEGYPVPGAEIRALPHGPDERNRPFCGTEWPNLIEHPVRLGVTDLDGELASHGFWFVIDLVIGAGLLNPAAHPDGERFTDDAVDMLVGARTLLSEGVQLEELTALAMRHATHVEGLVDDTIELFRRHHDRTGRDRSDLAATLDRLAPIATKLVSQHFERTLMSRALQRLEDSDDTAAAGSIVVLARRIEVSGSPTLAAFGSSVDRYRSLWLRPDEHTRIAALGAVETIEPDGAERFSEASAARAALSARVQRRGPADAPAPVRSMTG